MMQMILEKPLRARAAMTGVVHKSLPPLTMETMELDDMVLVPDVVW